MFSRFCLDVQKLDLLKKKKKDKYINLHFKIWIIF